MDKRADEPLTAYTAIQPPFAVKFREMSKPELKSYFDWFMRVMPERVRQLEGAVRATPERSSWQADLSRDSLQGLGEWFADQARPRAQPAPDEEVKAPVPFPIEVPGDGLSHRTLSLAMDIGMYFGQVVAKNLPGTNWEQPLKNPHFAEYGQPVLIGFGSVPLNPVRIAVMFAHGIAGKQQRGRRLRELYDTWAQVKSA